MADNNTVNAPIAGSLVSPAYKKMTTPGSYLDIQNDGWAKQYLPELYEQEVTRYGDRSISGFIQMMGAEMPMASDQVIWSEQGRLHLAYQGTVATGSGLVTAIKNIDQTSQAEVHAVRKGATVVGVVSGVVFKAFVTEGIEASETQLKIKPYGGTNLDNLSGISAGNATIKFFVYGSEFGKGTDAMGESVEPQFKTFKNNPLIIKDHFEINGSDTAQIGWIEVSGESGNSGYLWYLKSEGDTRARFNDYMEMVMIEAEKAAADVSAGVPGGSEGLLSAIDLSLIHI